MSEGGWIGVDLDGTLALYDGWKGPTHIGAPIDLMVQRIKQWRSMGISVKIFTARVCGEGEDSPVRKAIEDYCVEHVGEVLPITNQKDYGMIALWDDRAIQVIPNEGVAVEDIARRSLQYAQRVKPLLDIMIEQIHTGHEMFFNERALESEDRWVTWKRAILLLEESLETTE